MKWHLNSTLEQRQAINIIYCGQDSQTKTCKIHAGRRVRKNASAHTGASDTKTLDASLGSSQGELQGVLDERGDKFGSAEKDGTRRIGHSEVLHRAMYPNVHGNGIKKKKKKSWAFRRPLRFAWNISRPVWLEDSSGHRHATHALATYISVKTSDLRLYLLRGHLDVCGVVLARTPIAKQSKFTLRRICRSHGSSVQHKTHRR